MVKIKYKIVLVLLLSLVAFGLVAFSTIDTQKSNDEKESIYTTIVQSEEALLNIGVIPDSMLNTDKDNKEALSEVQAQELLTEKKAVFSNCYNEKLENIYTEQAEISISAAKKRAENMKQSNNANKGESADNIDILDVTIDSGVLYCDISSVSVNGDRAAASSVIVEWTKSIYFDKATKEYYVWLTFSEFDNKYNFVKRDDHWVVDSVNGDQLFAPADYDYRKGTFSSFDEAVTAAQKIVPSEENPF